MTLSTSVQGWIRTKSQHPILYVVLIETAISHIQYRNPPKNTPFGIDRQRTKQETSFKSIQFYLS